MAFLKCWSAITVLNLTTRNSRISSQIGSSSTELQVQDIHKRMEKWKIPWRPAKDSSWKRRKTNETHYWQSSDGATPQVRDSEPHQYKGWWVGAHTPCYQLLKSYYSQAVTWGPQREAWPLGKDYSASSTTVLQSHEGGRGNPNETTWGTEMEIRLLLTSSWPTLVWSSGRWTVLPQKPPPAALHPGALSSAKYQQWRAAPDWEWKQWISHRKEYSLYSTLYGG